MVAVRSNWYPIARVLVESSRTDVHKQTPRGESALTLARRAGERGRPLVDLFLNYRTVLFQSMQQTPGAREEIQRWLRGRLPESIKASLPPFNTRLLGRLPPPSPSLQCKASG